MQLRLGTQTPALWHPSRIVRVGACFVCFPKGFEGPGAPGDRAWAAAVATVADQVVGQAVVEGEAAASYRPGLLALREGPLLEAAVRALPAPLDVLLVDATGRDHPRRAGLALHLGAQLEIPSIGVTDRPLIAEGVWPPDEQGAVSPVRIEDEVVGYWVRTARGTRPLIAHAGWRTDPKTAMDIILAVTGMERTPVPLRLARQAAREARAKAARS